jgi:hypothetical protein
MMMDNQAMKEVIAGLIERQIENGSPVAVDPESINLLGSLRSLSRRGLILKE